MGTGPGSWQICFRFNFWCSGEISMLITSTLNPCKTCSPTNRNTIGSLPLNSAKTIIMKNTPRSKRFSKRVQLLFTQCYRHRAGGDQICTSVRCSGKFQCWLYQLWTPVEPVVLHPGIQYWYHWTQQRTAFWTMCVEFTKMNFHIFSNVIIAYFWLRRAVTPK